MASSSESQRAPWLPDRARRFGRATWRLTAHTVGASIRYRVTGLAAEAAFFTILSLPPLIFGLAGAIGYVAQRFDVRTIAGFRDQVLALASQALTPEAVDSVIAPTLDDVLAGGRFDIISIGFVIALWSGSRALNVFVDTITIMYGLGGQRGIVKTRALSFGLYLVFLLVGIVVLPLVLAGPTLVDRVVPIRVSWITSLYWPIVLVGSVFVLAVLYHLAVPLRTRLRANLPGAGLTMLIWVLGSYLLRLFLGQSVGGTSIYGPLAAPIALLIWLYVISLAILIGASFNAAADEVWPRLSGLHPSEDDRNRAATKLDNAKTELSTMLEGRPRDSARLRAGADGPTAAVDPAGDAGRTDRVDDLPGPLPGPGTAAEIRARERDPDH
ncbi:YihY/virulence factor BrkB family protein [Microlunatus ginsengisoli]|uniref:YihY/virulence factor BrkB family protein n=1 Tax=Microlunatus ginsengisoli TaxID=363863 RepID=A0ABP7ADL8_9ACTN